MINLEQKVSRVISVEKTGTNIEVQLIGTVGPKGDQGDPGPTGADGPQGPVGEGVPVGGTTGQVLAKKTNSDYDTEWVSGGGGVSDHGSLTGLSDDDHTQYHNDTRGDARYYTKSQSNSNFEPKNSNIQSHISNTSNPHGVTKDQVGLGNVDNTSDLNKPISTATQAALNLKADALLIPFSVSNTNTVQVTGTTSETLVYSLLIPANTLPSRCVLDLLLRVTRTSATGTGSIRIYTNTANTLTGALQFYFVNLTSGQNWFQVQRSILVSDGLSVFGASLNSDVTSSTSSEATYAFNVNVDNYILVSIQNSNASDNRSARFVALNRIG